MSRLEGTIRLAGLLEGPYAPEMESGVREWLADITAKGVQLELSNDGALFSLIPRTESPAVWRGRDRVDKVIGEALQDLLERLPDSFAKHCMCTLRSMEVLPGLERQTLYSIGPGNRIVVDQRDVQADTEAPPAPLDTRKLVRHGLIGTAILLLLFVVSIPFVPYRDWMDRIQSNMFRLPAEELRIHPGPFADLIEVTEVLWDSKEGKYRVTLRPGPEISGDGIEAYWREAQSPIQKLAAEDLIRGRITLEILDPENKPLGLKEVQLFDPAPEDGIAEYQFLIPPYAKMKALRFQL